MAHYFTTDNPYRHSHYIEGVIADNDNTLYKEPDNAKEFHCQAAVEAVGRQCPDIEPDEVRDLLNKSKEQYGGSLDLFEQEYGANMEQLRSDQYEILIGKTTDTGFFDPEDSPKAALAALRIAGVNIGIATHGNPAWTNHSLEQSGLSMFFNSRSLQIFKDDMENHAGKNISPAMYDAAMDAMHVPQTENPAERGQSLAMIEDTMDNLKYAKARGMMTVLIDTGRYEPDDIEEYVDVVVKDRHDAIHTVIYNNYIHEREMLATTDHNTAHPQDKRSGFVFDDPDPADDVCPV